MCSASRRPSRPSTAPEPPGYRERLRREGGALAGCGLVGSVVLVAFVPAARENRASTLAQLAVVLVLLAVLGPLGARRAMGRANSTPARDAGDGEPTPLWQLPLIVAVLALPFGLLGSWDAALRVTGGCLLVGLAQAVLLERVVAARERREGTRFVRLAGSRIVRGTRLGRLGRSRAPG